MEGKHYPYHNYECRQCFHAAEYDMTHVFHIQGEYILQQCSQHCHAQTYRNDDLIRKMVVAQQDMLIPWDYSRRPKCDAPMEVNKRKAEVGMVEDAEFHAQLRRYNAFLEQHQDDKVLYLEIGIGSHTTPQFVKHPFQRMTRKNENALYMTMNKKAYRIPNSI